MCDAKNESVSPKPYSESIDTEVSFNASTSVYTYEMLRNMELLVVARELRRYFG